MGSSEIQIWYDGWYEVQRRRRKTHSCYSQSYGWDPFGQTLVIRFWFWFGLFVCFCVQLWNYHLIGYYRFDRCIWKKKKTTAKILPACLPCLHYDYRLFFSFFFLLLFICPAYNYKWQWKQNNGTYSVNLKFQITQNKTYMFYELNSNSNCSNW